MPFFQTADGTTLHFRDTGTGRPVILIHGWAMSGRVWHFQRPLADRFRLIEIDLRGHGLSSLPQHPFTLAELAADVVALHDHLDLEHAVLVGWSLGSQVALAAFSALRSRLDRMILIGGTPCFVAATAEDPGLPLREVRGLELRLTRDFTKTMGTFFRQMFVEGELSREQESSIAHDIVMGSRLPDPEVARQGLAVLEKADLRPHLPEVDCPVVLFHGDQDTICPLAGARLMSRLLPLNQLHVLHGRGHAPFLSHPAEFNTLFAQPIGSTNDRY